jgi:hypothetical protein
VSDRPTVIVTSWRDGLNVFQDGAAVRAFGGAGASGLAPDGAGGAYVVVDSKEVWRWSPGGGWRLVAAGEGPLRCCLAVGERLLAGTDDARVLELADGRFFQLEGFDVTPGRERWYAGAALIDGKWLGPPLGVRSMSATCDGGAFLVNVHVGGVPRSTDGGAVWSPTIDIDVDVHQVAAHPSRPEVVAAAAGVGLCLSFDGGASWSVTTEGLHASYCSAVAFTQDELFLAASTDHFTDRGAVYRRRIDGSGPLQRVAGGLPEWLGGIVDTDCIAARGHDLVVVDRSGALYGSRDGGDSWSLWESGLPSPSGLLIC